MYLMYQMHNLTYKIITLIRVLGQYYTSRVNISQELNISH
jgi:hypothetical protein